MKPFTYADYRRFGHGPIIAWSLSLGDFWNYVIGALIGVAFVLVFFP
jgi:hypothetical protein